MDDRFIRAEHEEHEVPADPRPRAEKIQALLPPRRRRRAPLYIASGLLCVALGVAAALYFKPLTQTPAPAATSQDNAPASTDTPFTTQQATELFESEQLGLDMHYPKGWTVRDQGTKATISSPDVALETATGKQSGRIIVTIQAKQASLPVFSEGNAIAARDSLKISYSKPSSAQRAQTYLSFLHYAVSTTKQTIIDGIYITGDAGYLSGQAIPQVDVVRADPLLSVTFTACSDAVCSKPSPLNITSAQWDNTAFAQTINEIITSLVVY